VAEKAIVYMQWSNNSNRLVSFWGHADKALDALREVRGDKDAFYNRSGLRYMDKGQSDKFWKAAQEAGPAEWDDLSKKIAKEMVDISQWNYRRGAHPGLYKYALGRLFGQYGTWSLNYIEYVRRLFSNAKWDAETFKTAARLTLAHTAILKAGEAFGVDTGSWMFTEPIAYGGGPLFTATTSVPTAIGSWEGRQGEEARRNVMRPIFPMLIPGGLAGEQIYRAVTSENQDDLWKVIFGFKPMKPGEEDRGWHLATDPTKWGDAIEKENQ